MTKIRQRWYFVNSKSIFTISLIVMVATIVIIWLQGLNEERSIWRNGQYSTALLAVFFFLFLTIGLYNGFKLRDNLGKIIDKFRWKKPDIDLDISSGDLPDLGGQSAIFLMPGGGLGSIREGGLEEGIFPLRHPEGSGVRLLGTSEVLQVGRDERGNLGVALGLDVFERVLGREAVEAATGAVSPFRQGGIPSGASDRARLGFVPGPITASTFGREQAFPSQGFGRSGVLDMRRADRALDTFAERLERTTSRLEALENRAVRDPRVSDEQRRSQQQFRALRIRGGVRA